MESGSNCTSLCNGVLVTGRFGEKGLTIELTGAADGRAVVREMEIRAVVEDVDSQRQRPG